MARLWKRLQAALLRLGVAGLIIGFIAGIVAAAYFAAVFPDWTGFAADPIPSNTTVTPIVVYQTAKTLWDWLQLLLVPVVLAVGGYLFTRAENSQTRKVEAQRAEDAALKDYLDQMNQLLLHERLLTSPPNDVVHRLAGARTLTVLRVLDGMRKATVAQFLYEAGLIGGFEKSPEGQTLYKQRVRPIVSLEGADLKKANLSRANLRGADLKKANLTGANLSGANLRDSNLSEAILVEADLSGANLRGANLHWVNLDWADLWCANLTEADLTGADLTGANLSGAELKKANLVGSLGPNLSSCKVTRKQLRQAGSLEGAKLPFDMTPLPAPKVEVSLPKEQPTDLRGADQQAINPQEATMPDGSKHE